MIPKSTVTRILLSVLLLPTLAHAGPAYDLDDYGVVIHKKTNSAKPFMQINAGYGKFDNGDKTNALDYTLGVNVPVASDYSLDVALYHSNLGKQNDFKVKGYGLRTSLKNSMSEKSSLGISLGAGFTKQQQVEGAQLSAGLGYEYLITPSLAWNINAEYYFYAANSDSKWKGGRTGIRFYFK